MDVSCEISTNCTFQEGTADLEKQTFTEQKNVSSHLITHLWSINLTWKEKTRTHIRISHIPWYNKNDVPQPQIMLQLSKILKVVYLLIRLSKTQR